MYLYLTTSISDLVKFSLLWERHMVHRYATMMVVGWTGHTFTLLRTHMQWKQTPSWRHHSRPCAQTPSDHTQTRLEDTPNTKLPSALRNIYCTRKASEDDLNMASNTQVFQLGLILSIDKTTANKLQHMTMIGSWLLVFTHISVLPRPGRS